MKNLDLGQSVEILANIGVIAGIIFLGLELQQNNELLDSQARQSRANGARELGSAIFNAETGLGELVVKARSDVALTQTEALRLETFLRSVLLDWEFWYLDFADGTINEQELRFGDWGRQFNDVYSPEIAEIWEEARASSDPAFVQFMEEQVINR
jgi:hypothetical protein